MIRQIAQLQLYIEVLKKGYSIAESGLETVRAVRNGEFTLHDIFYGDLMKINPAIMRMPAAVNAIKHSQSIYRNARHFMRQITKEPSMEPPQRLFLVNTCNNLVTDVDMNIALLQQVLTPGKLQMSDNDRILQIEEILNESRRQLHFAKIFFNEARIIALSRRAEKVEGEVIGNLYNTKD